MKLVILLKNLNPKIIIFDFDGTIINSNQKKEEILAKSISNIYKLDLLYVEKIITNNIGKNREYYFKYFNDKFNKSHIDKYIELNRCFSENVKNIYKKAEIDSNLVKLKQYFPDSSWYIISSANSEEIKEVLEYKNISHFFINVYGGPKTKYQNYLENILEFVPNRDEVLHIGDGNQDIKFIEEANIKGLLLTKWSSEKELLLKYKESNNIFVYDSIFDFMEV